MSWRFLGDGRYTHGVEMNSAEICQLPGSFLSEFIPLDVIHAQAFL